MARWIEIPSRRVLEVTHAEFARDFRAVNQDGNAPGPGEKAYLLIRERDSRVFKPAAYRPAASEFEMNVCYLEEI